MEQRHELRRLREIVGRRLAWLVIPLALVAAAGVVIAVVLPNIYESSSTVLIENQQIPPTVVPSTVTSYAEQRIQNITQAVMSRGRILDLIKKHDLFPGQRNDLPTEVLVDKVRERLIMKQIDAEIHSERQNQPVQLTIAFQILFQDEVPAKAQAVANEIASYYLEQNLVQREEHARGTTQFLEQQLEEARSEITALEDRTAAFRQAHLEELPELMSLNMGRVEKLNADVSSLAMQIRSLEEQGASLRTRLAQLDPQVSERILSVDERLQQIEVERAQLLARYSAEHPQVQAMTRERDLLRRGQDPAASRLALEGRLKDLATRRAELSGRYASQHPEIQALDREEAQLREELHRLPAASPAPAAALPAGQPSNPAYVAILAELERTEVAVAALVQEKSRLEAQAAAVVTKLRRMPGVAKEANELETDYANAKAHYGQIMQKLLAAKVSQGMEEDRLGERFTVVEPAFLPEKPAKPNRWGIILLGLTLGLCLGVSLAALREYADQSVHDAASLEQLSGLPVLAGITWMRTPAEEASGRRRRHLALGLTAASVVLAVGLFHFLVMDLSIFQARAWRFLQSRFLLG
ncbi:MAG: hypothetical protein AB1634_17545 [Thermodesulfobacteriota bacterium]